MLALVGKPWEGRESMVMTHNRHGGKDLGPHVSPPPAPVEPLSVEDRGAEPSKSVFAFV